MIAGGPIASVPIAGNPGASGVVASGVLPALMVVGGFYSAPFVGSGGTAPYSYSATGLPTGLSINVSTGVVSGTATAAGSFSAIVTATDSLSASGSTPSMAITVIAVPALNRDFPNPRGKPWPWDVRLGWTWQTPTALYSSAAGYASSSKFIGYAVLAPPMSSVNASKLVAYAVLIPQPYYVQRHDVLPLPIHPGRWLFNRQWESAPPLPLQTTPYHPFGVQSFPDRFTRVPRQYMDHQFLPSVAIIGGHPPGAQQMPERFARRRRPDMDHGYFAGLRRTGEDMVVSFIWG